MSRYHSLSPLPLSVSDNEDGLNGELVLRVMKQLLQEHREELISELFEGETYDTLTEMIQQAKEERENKKMEEKFAQVNSILTTSDRWTSRHELVYEAIKKGADITQPPESWDSDEESDKDGNSIKPKPIIEELWRDTLHCRAAIDFFHPDGFTLLHAAIIHRNFESFKALVQGNGYRRPQASLLTVHKYWGEANIIHLLVRYASLSWLEECGLHNRPEITFLSDRPSVRGVTPLMKALFGRNREEFEYLLEMNVSFTTTLRNLRQRPKQYLLYRLLDWCKHSDNEKALEILRKYGTEQFSCKTM